MSANSDISWTDHTFNPWWGCQRVSPGCEHCYAETFAKRVGQQIWGPAKTTPRRFFGEKHWAEPLKWNRDAEREGVRPRVFCASMADVFEGHPDTLHAQLRLWQVIRATPHLDWLLLTKRPENFVTMLPWGTDPWPNVWLGVSTEDQQRADERIPLLLQTPAAVRFLSCEPLLGPVDLDDIVYDDGRPGEHHLNALSIDAQPEDDEDFGGATIDWVIAGGESGPNFRPMDLDWARSLRDQCQAAGVAFHFKQWGGRTHASGGRLLDGREWNEFPVAREAVLA